MKSISQSTAPSLFNAFQYLIGCNVDKRAFFKSRVNGQKRILEIGCSVGNIASVFEECGEVNYVGLDIDPAVIHYATERFRLKPNFKFVCEDLRVFAKSGQCFDLIFFGNVCHHIDDATSRELIQVASELLEVGGTLVVIDPLRPESEDPWYYRAYLSLFEKGEYVRSFLEEKELVENLKGLKVARQEIVHAAATPLGFPKVTRFCIFDLVAEGATSNC